MLVLTLSIASQSNLGSWIVCIAKVGIALRTNFANVTPLAKDNLSIFHPESRLSIFSKSAEYMPFVILPC